MEWRTEFAEFDGVTYLNMATQAPLPLAAARAAQQAIEWKKQPHTIPDDVYFGLPNRIRSRPIRKSLPSPPEQAAGCWPWRGRSTGARMTK
jgi:hypothetical protein